MDNFKIVEVGGRKYRLSKMNAIEQFNFLKPLTAVLSKAAGSDGAKVLEVIGDTIASMPDEVSDKILFKVLKKTYVVEPNGCGFSPVVVGTTLQYNDLEMAELLQLVAEFFKFNYANFIEKATSYLAQAQSQK